MCSRSINQVWSLKRQEVSVLLHAGGVVAGEAALEEEEGLGLGDEHADGFISVGGEDVEEEEEEEAEGEEDRDDCGGHNGQGEGEEGGVDNGVDEGGPLEGEMQQQQRQQGLEVVAT